MCEQVLNLEDVPAIDQSRLIAEFGGDQEILTELRDLFLNHAPPLFEAIVRSIDSQDMPAIIRDSHILKGACVTYGAARLTLVCREIELAAIDGKQDRVNALKDELETEYRKTVEEVTELGKS